MKLHDKSILCSNEKKKKEKEKVLTGNSTKKEIKELAEGKKLLLE